MENNRYSDAVVAELRACIARAGSTMSEVAYKTKMSKATLSRRLRPNSTLTIRELALIASALNIDVLSILSRVER